MTRIDAVQPFRGLVCISIVVMHFTTWEPGLSGISPRWFYYRPGVESFIVLSGFFIAHSLRPASSFSIAKYLQTRLARLVVPYWVALTVTITVFCGRMLRLNKPLPAITDVIAEYAFVADVFCVPASSASFWSLATLIQLYILTATVFWMVRWFHLDTTPDYHQRTLGVLKVAATIILIATTAGHIYGYLGLVSITGWRLPHWIPFATAGFLAYQSSCKATLLVAAILAYTGWHTAGTDRWLWGAVTTVIIKLLGTYNPKVPPNPFHFAGRISFSVYLVHEFIGHYVLILWLQNYLGDFPKIVYVLAAFVLTWPTGYAFYELVEQPTARYARKIVYREESGN